MVMSESKREERAEEARHREDDKKRIRKGRRFPSRFLGSSAFFYLVLGFPWLIIIIQRFIPTIYNKLFEQDPISNLSPLLFHIVFIKLALVCGCMWLTDRKIRKGIADPNGYTRSWYERLHKRFLLGAIFLAGIFLIELFMTIVYPGYIWLGVFLTIVAFLQMIPLAVSIHCKRKKTNRSSEKIESDTKENVATPWSWSAISEFGEQEKQILDMIVYNMVAFAMIVLLLLLLALVKELILIDPAMTPNNSNGFSRSAGSFLSDVRKFFYDDIKLDTFTTLLSTIGIASVVITHMLNAYDTRVYGLRIGSVMEKWHGELFQNYPWYILTVLSGIVVTKGFIGYGMIMPRLLIVSGAFMWFFYFCYQYMVFFISRERRDVRIQDYLKCLCWNAEDESTSGKETIDKELKRYQEAMLALSADIARQIDANVAFELPPNTTEHFGAIIRTIQYRVQKDIQHLEEVIKPENVPEFEEIMQQHDREKRFFKEKERNMVEQEQMSYGMRQWEKLLCVKQLSAIDKAIIIHKVFGDATWAKAVEGFSAEEITQVTALSFYLFETCGDVKQQHQFVAIMEWLLRSHTVKDGVDTKTPDIVFLIVRYFIYIIIGRQFVLRNGGDDFAQIMWEFFRRKELVACLKAEEDKRYQVVEEGGYPLLDRYLGGDSRGSIGSSIGLVLAVEIDLVEFSLIRPDTIVYPMLMKKFRKLQEFGELQKLEKNQ